MAKKATKESSSTQGQKAAAKDQSKKILGPYELWNFENGTDFRHSSFPLNSETLTALARVKEKLKFEKLSPAARNQDGHTDSYLEWFPTIWRPAEFKSRFLPIVIKPRSNKPSDPEIKTIASSFLSASTRLFNFEKDSSDRENKNYVENFRIAFPVVERSLNDNAFDFPSDPTSNLLDDVNPSDFVKWTRDENIYKRFSDENRKPDDRNLTVIAVIDDGIPFAHQNFRTQSGKNTRVEFCWQQSVARDENLQHPSVRFGREFTRNRIDKLIKKYGSDEDFLYHQAGALDEEGKFGSILEQHATHGAHVMDRASGFAPDVDDDTRNATRIIAVQLPHALVADTSVFGKDAYILSAFHYIFDRADILGREYGVENLRLVINMSFGFSGGSHDGRTDLERAIDNMVRFRREELKRPTALVLPSGNMFLARLYGEIHDENFIDDEFSFDWVIQPNDQTSNYMEIWFPDGFDPHQYNITVNSPGNTVSASMSISAPPLTSNDRGDSPDNPRKDTRLEVKTITLPHDQSEDRVVGQLTSDRLVVRGRKAGEPRLRHRWRIVIALAPTEIDAENYVNPIAGTWKVSLTRPQTDSGSFPTEPIKIRVQRDENISTMSNGARQSYLADQNYNLFDNEGKLKNTDDAASHIKRFGSLNGLATGKTSLVVAGYTKSGRNGYKESDGMPSSYSSAGSMAGSTNSKVDVSAMSDRSTGLPGVTAAGTRSGSVSQLRGTSTAAPFVARAIAEAFTVASINQVKHSEHNNYLPLISGLVDGLSSDFVQVTKYHDTAHQNPWVANARLGDFVILSNDK